jgi:hypothetical protein
MWRGRASHEQTNLSFGLASYHATPSPETRPRKIRSVGKAAIPVAGGADPGRGAERFSERHFGGEPAANQGVRIRRLKDVAERPIMETGAGVPGYSGGLAAAWLFRIRRLRNIGARATSGGAGVRIRIKAFVSGA